MTYLSALRFFFIVSSVFILCNCESKQIKPTPKNTQLESTQEPKPKKILIQESSQINSTAAPNKTIEKNLAYISVSPDGITLNNVKVNNIQKLKQLLKKYSKPVITITAHRCTDAKLTTQIMTLAQDQTNTPIPYGSFGKVTDPICH